MNSTQQPGRDASAGSLIAAPSKPWILVVSLPGLSWGPADLEPRLGSGCQAHARRQPADPPHAGLYLRDQRQPATLGQFLHHTPRTRN